MQYLANVKPLDCVPVIQEPHQSYPAGYVSSLEDHVAALERSLNEKLPGTSTDHLESRDQLMNSRAAKPSIDSTFNSNPYYFDPQNGHSSEAERGWQWQQPQSPTIMTEAMAIPLSGRANDHSSPPDFAAQSVASASQLASSLPIQRMIIPKSDGPEDIPTATAASFFRTYFQSIHPQYPFLSIQDCSNWYNEWKMAPPHNPLTGWPAYFVKMVRYFRIQPYFMS